MSNLGLHFIYLYADSASEWNCSEWRALSPSSAINAEHEAGRTPHTAQLFFMPTALDWRHPEVQKKIGRGDVLVFQRNAIIKEVWDAMDYWRALGKLVVLDTDDHYPGLPPSNPAFDYWIRNKPNMNPEPILALTEGMRHADFVTSPSKVILDDWSHILPGYHLPNWTRRAWYEPLVQKPIGAPDIVFDYDLDEQKQARFKFGKRPDSEGLVMLGWGGSISHVDSWIYSGVMEALDRIFEKYPQARLKFCGFEGRLDYLFKRWGDKVIKQAGVRAQEWPQVVATFDVGLAPLDLRPLEPWREGAPIAAYDERRSWLKGVEYLSAGVPWVGSQSLTYADLGRWGTLVDNTPDAWFNALSRKIDNLKTEKETAWERRRWAFKHVTFESNVTKYGEIFGRMVAHKQARGGGSLPDVVYVKPEPEPEPIGEPV
jgi:glycosyltransferase involved in cell wall biosynthesis